MQPELSLQSRHIAGSPFASKRERGVFHFIILIASLLLACFVIEAIHGMPPWLAALPFAASLFFCGMPHGAVDWQIHRRLFGSGSLAGSLLAFGPYTTICVLCAVVLWAVPVGYIVFFLLLTLLHFGRADARIRTGKTSASAFETVRGVARAAAVVVLPFSFQPAATSEAIARVSALVGGPEMLPPGFAIILGIFGAAGIVVWLIDALISREDPAFVRLLPLAIIATSALLPPLFSVGIWFLLWHATRECVVLGGKPSHPFRSVAMTHLRSVPLMLPTLALALALGIFAGAPASVVGVAVVTLTLYAVFTPAHHFLQELAAAKDAQFGIGAG